MTNWKEVENENLYCCGEYQIQFECVECGEYSTCTFCDGFDEDEQHDC